VPLAFFAAPTAAESSRPLRCHNAEGSFRIKLGLVGSCAATQTGVTTYFRNTFFIPFRENVLSLRGDLRRDDGAVCYLNGVEVRP
jgi:hypothetical protein